MDLSKYEFEIETDFNIRVLREDESDFDIIIPMNNRCVNVYFEGMPKYIIDRIQCSMVKNILIRISKLKTNTKCTIHFLRNIDLHSSILNFVFDYKNNKIVIKDLKYFAEFKIINN